ncbi:transcription-repair coupling factor [Firmicutes bacterium M10-2]|nr:transcription-repair coupling factor [Firmicutes bacterium M10-2]
MKDPIMKQLVHDPVTQAILHSQNNIGNLYPMEEALLLCAAFHADHKTRIIVKKNRYEANQLYERIEPMEENTLLFTMEESLRVQAIASSPEDRQQLLHTLNTLILDPRPRLIVCNTAAFLRFLPSYDFMKENIFSLRVGEQMDMAELKRKLNRIGYGKVNYVDRPCTYAARGGIVDVFSLGYDHPIRIEFFDTEIDSIRLVNEQTQRTIESIDQCTISPASDLLFTDEQIEELRSVIKEKLNKEKEKLLEEEQDILQDHIEADLLSLETFDPESHLYWYYSYIKSDQLLDYVKGEVILSSQESVERAAKKLNEDNIAFMQEMVQDHKALPRYIMFHDLYHIKEYKNFLMFHEFQSLKDPISSGIHPLDRIAIPLTQFFEIHHQGAYFALNKEDRERVKSLSSFPLEFISDEFYEGFSYDGEEIYTSRELFEQTLKHHRYKKSFKEGQVLENVLELEKYDYVVHEQYGIGQYLGIVTRENNGKRSDYLYILYRGGDELYVPLSQFQLVRKYISKEGTGIKLSQLGSNQWQKTKERVNAKIEEIAGRLVELYAHRNEEIGYAFPKDDALQEEFDHAFEYEATPDQLQATYEIKEEMEKAKPMDHLLCGDVGFGKTEVAMRCAFKAIENGKQVAFLCPTTILSMQHYKTLTKRFEYTGANIALVNRFISAKEIKEIKKGLKEGTIDIVIGTHKLLNKSFEYKDLGFLIIDEEQRFGVEHKEKIKEMKDSIDVLSLSATPIPRTLQMSLIGVRTISQLNTSPAHRHPIQTYILERKGSAVEEIIQRELARDGQVFYLHNRVANIYNVARDLQKKFPDTPIAIAHGQMKREEIEQTMYDFAMGKYKILVCTTIIETGLDIANANTIVIDQADHFGLSQLYQIRGRVGRRDKIGYCYLMVDPQKEMTEQAQKRLQSIKEFTQLGSGYKIAMRDLTIRGAGDMLGPQQAGFIDQVGLDMYLELLSKAIAKKQGKSVEKENKPEKSAQVQVNGYIPTKFTDNDGDKLDLYQEIRAMKTLNELHDYENRIIDLFGKIPKEVKQLFKQRQLDLFVNEEYVESMKETKTDIVVVMSEQWSKCVDGAKLFTAMNSLSRKIRLALRNKKIEITIEKKLKYIDLLIKSIELLEEANQTMMRKENKI